MENTFRWLHLSDIHFQGNESYETKKMRDILVDKIKELVHRSKIDMVILTGDLAYQGNKYDNDLKKFIEELVSVTGISKDGLIIIPGNHDLKRAQKRTLIVESSRKDDIKFEKDTIKSLHDSFKTYSSFYKKVKDGNAVLNYEIIKCDKVNLFLMNTALTAGTDTDDGNLVVDKDEFYSSIHKLKDKESCINIAVGHHPLTCFSDNHQNVLRNNFIDYNIDMYLCGHMHKAGYDFDINSGRIIPTYKCGAGMVDEYATTTFIVGELDLDLKKGALTYFHWLTSEEIWIVGGAEGRRAANGKIDITLERFLKANSEEHVEINEDEFRRFMMDFHDKITKKNIQETNIDPKDVFEKFDNMKCNKSVIKQYDSFSRYFPVIDEIMESTLLSQIEKESIPNVVISEYNKIVGKADNGTEIIEAIVENILKEYGSEFSYSNTTLKRHFKVLVYWSIYECDIFNDEL